MTVTVAPVGARGPAGGVKGAAQSAPSPAWPPGRPPRAGPRRWGARVGEAPPASPRRHAPDGRPPLRPTRGAQLLVTGASAGVPPPGAPGDGRLRLGVRRPAAAAPGHGRGVTGPGGWEQARGSRLAAGRAGPARAGPAPRVGTRPGSAPILAPLPPLACRRAVRAPATRADAGEQAEAADLAEAEEKGGRRVTSMEDRSARVASGPACHPAARLRRPAGAGRGPRGPPAAARTRAGSRRPSRRGRGPRPSRCASGAGAPSPWTSSPPSGRSTAPRTTSPSTSTPAGTTSRPS